MVATYVKKENTTTTLFVYENQNQQLVKSFGIRSNIMFSKANGEVKRLLVTSENLVQVKVQLYRM